jgi:hypothetical protein
MLNVVMLSVIYADCHYTYCYLYCVIYAEFHGQALHSECHYIECQYCCYAECRKNALLLCAINLNVVMLSVANKPFMPSIIMLNVIKWHKVM